MLPAVTEDSDALFEALSGEIDPEDGLEALQTAGEGQGIPENTEIAADPVDRLRALIGERQEETVEILRNWLEEKEENA